MSSRDPGVEAKSYRIDLASTVLLAFAAVATAWTTAQVTRWRDTHSSHSTNATVAHIEASRASTRAGAETQVDIATFIQWVDANAAEDNKLATFYRRRFRPEFRPAFAAWLKTEPLTNPQAPPTPFAMLSYRVKEAATSEQLTTLAGRQTKESRNALTTADDYLFALVLFATALFFAAISTKIPSLGPRQVLLAIGWVIFLGAAVWIATLPVALSL
jgi:hypothetical protein